jgi:hypothetical protein
VTSLDQLSRADALLSAPVSGSDDAARVATHSRLCFIACTTAIPVGSTATSVGLIGALLIGVGVLSSAAIAPFLLVFLGGLAALYVVFKTAATAYGSSGWSMGKIAQLKQKAELFVASRYVEGDTLKDRQVDIDQFKTLKAEISNLCIGIIRSYSAHYQQFISTRKHIKESLELEQNDTYALRRKQDWQKAGSELFDKAPFLTAFFLQEEKFRVLEVSENTSSREIASSAIMLYMLLGSLYWGCRTKDLRANMRTARAKLQTFSSEMGASLYAYRDTPAPMRLDVLFNDWMKDSGGQGQPNS